VERVFDGLLKEAGGRARYEIADFAPSGSVDLDHPLIQDFISGRLEVRPKQAWTDVARFAQHGVAAANFGPGLTTQAHQQNEYAELPLLLESYERLRAFLEESGP
jgi:succinyl-diaminopimelate desuccinylase